MSRVTKAILKDGYSAMLQETVYQLSKKEVSPNYILEKLRMDLEKLMGKTVYDFFFDSRLTDQTYFTNLAALMDMVQRIKQHESDTYRNMMGQKTVVEHNHVTRILDRHDVPYKIEGSTITIADEPPVPIPSLSFAVKINEKIPNKLVEISKSTQNEEKRQPYLLKAKKIFNPMIEDELPPVNHLDAYESVVIGIKEPYKNNPMNYRNLINKDQITDLNEYIHSILPAARESNPDYLYAIGHQHAHFYDKKRYLYDRFIQILANSKFDPYRDKIKIVSYDEENRRRFKKAGYPVLSGYSTMLNSNDVIFISPDICDAGWAGEYDNDKIPKMFRRLNRFLNEVEKFKTSCEMVYYPYYPTWNSKEGKFDVVNFTPLTLHRPFVLVGPGLDWKLQRSYVMTTVKLSYYRTWLMYTGEPYDYLKTMTGYNEEEDSDLKSMAIIVKKINELVIEGTGYLMKGGDRILLPKEDLIANGLTVVKGREEDYIKMLSPITSSKIKLVSRRGGECFIKNNSKESTVTRIKAESSLLFLSRYNDKLNRLLDKAGMRFQNQYDEEE
jgi:hypothetical protein